MKSSVLRSVSWPAGFLELHESNKSPVQEQWVEERVSSGIDGTEPPAGTRGKMMTNAFQFTCFVLPVQGGYFWRNCKPLVIKIGECYKQAHFYISVSLVIWLIGLTLNQALKESTDSISDAWSRCVIVNITCVVNN